MTGRNPAPLSDWTPKREAAVASFVKAYAEKHNRKRNIDADQWRDRYERLKRHSWLRFSLRLWAVMLLLAVGSGVGWILRGWA